MGLFTDIYNTVAKFFRPQEEQNGDNPSKTVATNRLKLVLMQDRTNLTPKVLEQMRGEMIELLSKYLEMDKDLLELNFEQDGDQVALMLSIPVIRAKDEDEIESSSDLNSDEDLDECEENSEDYNEEIETSTEDYSENAGDCEPKKTRKRRSKKVTAPEELNSEHEEHCDEASNENSEEFSTNEQYCEHHE